jgi:hypothetical protein
MYAGECHQGLLEKKHRKTCEKMRLRIWADKTFCFDIREIGTKFLSPKTNQNKAEK